MKQMLLLPLLLLLPLHLTLSYTIEEILKDHDPFLTEGDLVKSRGPILENIWIDTKQQASDTEVKQQTSDSEVCDRLFEKSLELKNVTWPPPVNPPSEFMDWFTMGGRARYDEWYVVEEDVGNGGKGYNWTRAVMEEARSKANTCGMHHVRSCGVMMDRYASVMKGKSSLVMGSGLPSPSSSSTESDSKDELEPRYKPWAEAALFNANVRHVTTVEPIGVKISSDYENFTSLELSEVGRRYLERKWEGVDVAFSFSSLKHEGLGRLGEPLNPFGDLESVGRIRCLLKPGGLLFVGFPMSADEVWWNGHRLYGRYRLFLLLLGWRVVDLYPDNCVVDPAKAVPGYVGCQPVMLLQKTDVLKPSDMVQSLKPQPQLSSSGVSSTNLRGSSQPQKPPRTSRIPLPVNTATSNLQTNPNPRIPSVSQMSKPPSTFQNPSTPSLPSLSQINRPRSAFQNPSTSSNPSASQMNNPSFTFQNPSTTSLPSLSQINRPRSAFQNPSTSSNPSVSQINNPYSTFQNPSTPSLPSQFTFQKQNLRIPEHRRPRPQDLRIMH